MYGLFFVLQMTEKPSWVKEKTYASECKEIECPPYDDYKDHKNDFGCYVLIRVRFDTYQIELAVCNYNHEILAVFRGRRPQDIWHMLFSYEEQNKKEWFTVKDHIAYIGKELKKAEVALVMGTTYYQE